MKPLDRVYRTPISNVVSLITEYNNYSVFYSYRDEHVCNVMIENNAVPKIVDMIVSDHEVMQNESLIALTIMSALVLPKTEKIFVDCKIGERLVCLINEKKPQKEVFGNVLTLIQMLAVSGTSCVSF